MGSKLTKWFGDWRRDGLCIRVALKDRVHAPIFILPSDELRLEYILDLPDHGIRVTLDMQFLVSRSNIYRKVLDLSLYPKAVEKL